MPVDAAHVVPREINELRATCECDEQHSARPFSGKYAMSTTETIIAEPAAVREFPQLPVDLPFDSADFPTDAEIEAILPHVELIESDGENMDSEIHRMSMELLLAAISCPLRRSQRLPCGGQQLHLLLHRAGSSSRFQGAGFLPGQGRPS